MMLKLKFQHLFLVTICFALSEVESLERLRVEGCWPNGGAFLSKDSLSLSSAKSQVTRAIEEHPKIDLHVSSDTLFIF